MKHILLILLLSAITLLSPLVSNANAIGVTTVKAKLNGNYSAEQKEEISKILKKRFEDFSRKDVNVKIENDSIFVKIFIEVELQYCTDLMTKKGELLIIRPYAKDELFPYLQKIDNLLNTPDFKAIKNELCSVLNNEIVEEATIVESNYVEKVAHTKSAYYDNPLFKIMTPSVNYEDGNAVVGTSHMRDTAKVNRLFRNPVIKKHLPFGIRFIWTTSDYRQCNTLCAIKNPSPDNEYVTNYMIESSKAIKGYRNNIESSIQFKKEYHALWKKLTRDNIGRQLLVIIDNEVVMYPYVNGEIEGGRVTISGGMDGYKNRIWAAILNSDLLNADIEVLEVTHDYPPMYYLMKLFN